MNELKSIGITIMRAGTILTIAGLAIIFPYISIPAAIGYVLYRMFFNKKVN